MLDNETVIHFIFSGYRYDQVRFSEYEAGFGENISQEDIVEALNAVVKKANQLYGTNLQITNANGGKFPLM